MSRRLIALAATLLMTAAAPASAFSLQLDFHPLTYPPKPGPEASQGCAQPAALQREACVTSTK